MADKWEVALVKLTEDDLALAAHLLANEGRALKQAAIHVQGDQCLRIAEALRNARILKEVEGGE